MKLNKKTGALAGLAALAVVGGTWAYFSQTAAITNPFNTGAYNTSIVEHFNPADGDNWVPGAEVDKVVSAKNTGTAPVLVRVRMDEAWSRDGKEAFIAFDTGNGDMKPFTSAVIDGNGVITAVQTDDTDGTTAGDESVVYKLLDADKWEAGDDGYWYYKGVLGAGAVTEPLMTKVALANNTDMGKYIQAKGYYIMTRAEAEAAGALDAENKIKADFDIENYLMETDGKDWAEAGNDDELKALGEKAKEDGNYFFIHSENTLDPDAMGYARADYNLTITTEFIQATQDAAEGQGWNLPAGIIPAALAE